MTTEEKTKAYDEAFGLIKRFYHNFKGDTKFIIDKAFPQLNENEDERIRKELIEFFTFEHWNGKAPFSAESAKERITWLEKQGEQKPTIYHKFRAGDTIRHIKQGFTCKIDSVDTEYRVSECGKGTHLPFDSEDYYELVEQKPADKVEPKFKVGDWVITSYGKVNQIIAVNKYADGFTLDDDTYFSGSWKDSYHLWTIQDAQPGDVLVITMYPEGTWVCIFKELTGCIFSSYCFVNTEGIFKLGTNNHSGKAIHPATKEQRDLLFQKMKESGYKWENSQLKEINDEGFVDLWLPSGTL